MSAVEMALALAAMGVPAFPCRADKRPMTPRGFHDATTDRDKLREMFAAPGAVLVAVPTGASSRLVVLDGDVTPEADGRAMLRHWTMEGRLPRTRVHETRRRGVHLLFRHDPAHPLRCSQGKLAPRVDVRGDGGYIVWWPGSGGAVLAEVPLCDLPELPDWLPAALTPAPETAAPAAPPRACRAIPDATARRLEAVIRAAALAPEGSRNGLLYWASRRCAEMVAEGRLVAASARAALVAAGTHAGLSEREATATVASGLGAGGAHGR
jgi:hypothetical protein